MMTKCVCGRGRDPGPGLRGERRRADGDDTRDEGAGPDRRGLRGRQRRVHPGLIMSRAARARRPRPATAALRAKAVAAELGVVGMPVNGQQTTTTNVQRDAADPPRRATSGSRSTGPRRPSAASQARSPCCVSGSSRDVPQDRGDDERRDREADRDHHRDPRRPRSLVSALARLLGLDERLLEQPPRPRELEREDRQRDGMTTKAGPGSTSIATPASSSVKPATTNPARTIRGRSRWRSRCARRRSTSEGWLIPLR